MSFAKAQVANTLGSVPEVEGVYFLPSEGNDIRVVTVVDREDDRVYERIYATELQLAREVPGAQFDFSVVARRGRPIEQVMGSSHPVWERPAPHGESRRAS